MTNSTHDDADNPRNDTVLINVDGAVVQRERAVVSVFDSGFILGDGVGEGLRLVGPIPDGRAAFYQKHMLPKIERESDRLGHAPPVIDTRDILSDPRGVLTAPCVALDVAFSEKILSWPAGSRATDGIWAPVWYDAVERSTSFGPPRSGTPAQTLPEQLKPVLDAARPLYERLARHRLESVTR